MTIPPWLGLLASVPGLSNVPGFRAGRRAVSPAARAGRIARVIFQDDGLVLAEGVSGKNSLVGT